MVCGEEGDLLVAVAQDDEIQFQFVPSQSLRQWQLEMARLLRRQRERGGVIDQEEINAAIDLNWVGVATCSREHMKWENERMWLAEWRNGRMGVEQYEG